MDDFDSATLIDDLKRDISAHYNLSIDETEHFVALKNVSKEMYVAKTNEILLMDRNGELSNLSYKSNILRDERQEISDSKTFLIYPQL